jgi:histidyl-tRNA synthetase
MHTFNDKGDRSITLRPGVTAGVMRAVLRTTAGRCTAPPTTGVATRAPFPLRKPTGGRWRRSTSSA